MASHVPNTLDGVGQDSWIAQRYRLGSELSKGGMGSVYRVLDERTGEARALKRLLHPATDDMRALFEREYATLAGIKHPRIIEVFDYGIDRGEAYYTMELLDGQDLNDVGALPFKTACRYLRDVATSLALLHTRRLLHRDVKPSNIRLTPDGRCKLLDFGALTPFGVPERVVGTPPYVPPEALSGAPLDQRADLFSFGALCYRLLTRRHAYPAREFSDLPRLWQSRAVRPSRHEPSIPKAADHLILSLLDPDPMARPNSMAEVVELLTALADLPPEDDATQDALAQSYLSSTQFVGRRSELAALTSGLAELSAGRGSARLLEGPSGSGRTRLLDELDIRSRIAGVMTVRIDAAMHESSRGPALALIAQLVEKNEAARTEAQHHAALLRMLDPDLGGSLGRTHAVAQGVLVQPREVMYGILRAATQDAGLLLIVDNADLADEASLGLFAAALHLTRSRPVSLVLVGQAPSKVAGLPGSAAQSAWSALRDSLERIDLEPFAPETTLELARSMFGDVPNLIRFAEWLHGRCAGFVLHCVELIQRLHAEQVIRFHRGQWLLPASEPDAGTSERLELLFDRHLDALSGDAYAFAEQVALGRRSSSFGPAPEANDGLAPFAIIEELLRHNVLVETAGGYAIRNNGIREALRRRMTDARKRELHLRCAEEILARAPEGSRNHATLIEAGWHLIHAGEDERGADLLATVAYDTIGVRLSFADLQVVAPALEAALQIFERQGRSMLERAPLLAALAQAGYYEHRRWADKYGDAAIAAFQDVIGLSLATKLQRYLGKTLGLVIGLASGLFRRAFAPRRARRCSYAELIVQLMGLVTTLAGVAACALDVERARRMARILDPFMHLPERLTPVGIRQFALALCEVGRDNPAEAMRQWTTLQERFADPRYYPTLPQEARPLYIGGLWFARGVFECMRDGDGALRAADALDELGIKLYRMIASELRVFHYTCRGEPRRAAQHMEQLELHVIEMGSASQIELWEPAAGILPHSIIGDVVPLRRVAERLRELSPDNPSLVLFAQLAESALENTLQDRVGDDAAGQPMVPSLAAAEDALIRLLDAQEPRSFIGWGATSGFLARALNRHGRYADAKASCERVLLEISDADREFVAMFLAAELELAVADAGLGDARAASARLDALLLRHGQGDSALTRGRIHDAYCRVAALAERWDLYRHHLAAARDYYRSLDHPALAARAKLLAALEQGDPRATLPKALPSSARLSGECDDVTRVTTGDLDLSQPTRTSVHQPEPEKV